MNKDVFDKIMEWHFLSVFAPFYKKHKEILLYLFFGGLTFLVSVCSYSFGIIIMDMDPLIANLLSWILAVSFAYITNRIWVFCSQASDIKGIAKEVWEFTLGRIATLIIEELILYIFITKLNCDGVIIKIIAQIVVIVLNYVISKLFVFDNRTE